MRIAEIAPAPLTVPPESYGGIELVVSLLSDGLVDRGHEVTLFASGGSRSKAGVVSPLEDPPGTDGIEPFLELSHALIAYERASEFDIIHDHTGIGPAIGGVLDDAPPVVHTLHGPWTDAARRYYSMLHQRVRLVAISEAQKALNPDISYAGVVYNGIDLDAYPYRSDKEDFLVFLGRSSPEKGPELAVEIAKQAGMHLKLLIKIGEPPEREHWEQVVAPRLTGDEEVIESAPHDLKVDVLGRARALVFPIQWNEPFGLVMIESMACGTPVIARPQGASTEVVEDGVTGFFADDIEGLVERIPDLDRIDPEDCRRRVGELFSAEAMVSGYERIFEVEATAAEASSLRLRHLVLAPVPRSHSADRSAAGRSTVSLVEGSLFVISNGAGDLLAGPMHGVFEEDTRFLSQLEVLTEGQHPELLTGKAVDPSCARFVLRLPWEGPGESPLTMVRTRLLKASLEERLELTNFSPKPLAITIDIRLRADFADVFDVRSVEPHRAAAPRVRIRRHEGVLRFEEPEGGWGRSTAVRFDPLPDDMSRAGARYRITLKPGSTWSATVEVSLQSSRAPSTLRANGASSLAERRAAWLQGLPTLHSNWRELDLVYQQALADLTSLVIVDEAFPEDLVFAGGLPWFMTLFGRDALLTALMLLPFDRTIARGVLRTLARYQGTKVDPASEEQPGKILHERRAGAAAARRGRTVYYGTIDATPLFVILAGEARRWGLPWPEIESLLPHIRAAVKWMQEGGDADGDGYLEYGESAHGLRNQGWKDSWNGIQYADGRLPRGSIALAEVQGYAYRAWLEAATLFDEAGEHAEAQESRAQAGAMAERFRRDYWMEEANYPATGLDDHKRRVDSITSNAGHLLWSGILTPEQEKAVARRLLGPDLFSGWGVRTLAASSRGYNPVSYHAGSVWPHDTAIAVTGLVRLGLHDEAVRVAAGLLDAAAHFSNHLPELFAGFGRDQIDFPVSYPAASIPQAWAAGSALLLLSTLLGMRPEGEGVALDPILPADALPLRLEGLAAGEERISLRLPQE